MKKIFTLLIVFTVTAGAVTAQNLLPNAGLETWADGKALPWDFYAGGNANVTYTQFANTMDGSASSVKIVNTASGATANVSQQLPTTGMTVGDVYLFSFDYFVEGGDETDARMWAGWKSFDSGTSKYTDIIHDYAVLRHNDTGDGKTTEYLPSNTGKWTTFSGKTSMPANAAQFDFRVRSYKGSIVAFDNFKFYKEGTNSIGSENASAISVYKVGDNIEVKNAEGTAVVYNLLGAKVAEQNVAGDATISGLTLGQVYIVKIGGTVTKVAL